MDDQRDDRKGRNRLTDEYWLRNCPVCEQGRVLFVRNNVSQSLALVCEECESAWSTPDDASDPAKCLSYMLTDARIATLDEIQCAGWDRNIKHTEKHFPTT